jgi:small subunit ribosomal protein S20
MAKHKSAVREMRRSLRRNVINKKTKSAVRTEVRRVREALLAKDRAGAQKSLPEAYATIDQAVKKGAIHKNKGSRLKSRISRQLARQAVPAEK